ncbi:MAG: hypothetical protein ACRD4O_12965 [Bryobacteraceae bacterium]
MQDRETCTCPVQLKNFRDLCRACRADHELGEMWAQIWASEPQQRALEIALRATEGALSRLKGVA